MKEVTFQRVCGGRSGTRVVSESLWVRYRPQNIGTSLAQRRSVWEEPGQGPGGPTGCSNMYSLPPLLKTGARLELARLLRFEFRL